MIKHYLETVTPDGVVARLVLLKNETFAYYESVTDAFGNEHFAFQHIVLTVPNNGVGWNEIQLTEAFAKPYEPLKPKENK